MSRNLLARAARRAARLPVRPLLLPAALLASAWLGGCASSRQSDDGFFAKITPYRIEVVQGNVVTSEQAARVKPGQTRAQVRDILGTPLVTDPFHGDRWDYIFTIRRDGLPNQRRSVVVWFEGDALKTIEAPDLPTERDFVQGISLTRKKPEPPVLELTEAQRQALPAPPPAPEAPAAEPTGPTRAYPPLGD
jgi:outer membrane protein assembly factor BamE